MAITDTYLPATALETILERLGTPGALTTDQFLHSWLVQDYLAENPNASHYAPEFLIGQALEEQLRLWSGEFRLHSSYTKRWNEIFCLKAAYFQTERGINVYRARPTLAQLGVILLDGQVLAHLVPGREDEAEALWKDPNLGAFWRSFTADRGESLSDSTVSSRLKRVIRNFANWLERRRGQRLASPASEPCDGQPSKTTCDAAASALSPALDVTSAYLDLLFATGRRYVPPEWAALIEKAALSDRLIVRDRAGTGKTCLLYAIGDALRRQGAIPLYVRLPEYAPFAAEIDLLRFAATRGVFGQAYRDEVTQKAFESALANAQREGRLVLLADEVGDLLENELASVAARLRDVRRLVLVERQPRLSVERITAVELTMPFLSAKSLTELLQTLGLTINLSLLDRLQTLGLTSNLELVVASARCTNCSTLVQSAQLLSEWVGQRLQRSCRSNALGDTEVQALRLLQHLAAIRLGMQTVYSPSLCLGRNEILQSFATLQLPVEQHREGWTLVDWVVRAGLLERAGDLWEFSYPALMPFFAGAWLIEGDCYSDPRTQLQKQSLHWAAALLAQRGDERQLRLFTARAMRSLESYSRLSVLDVAAILTEFNGFPSPFLAEMRVRITEQLSSLAALGSPWVRSAVYQRAEQLGVSVGLTEIVASSDEVNLPSNLDTYATDLAGLLSLLNLLPPKGTESDWLEHMIVQNGLIEALCNLDNVDLKKRCAAWLRRSSLSQTIAVQLLPPRRCSALEILANVASEAQFDDVTRATAKVALARESFVLRLWQLGADYAMLVYDLLLALGKRLYREPGSSQWKIVE